MSVSADYEQRRTAAHDAAGLATSRGNRLGDLRLLSVGVAVVLGFAALGADSVPWWTVLLPLAAFAALVVVDARLMSRRDADLRRVDLYEHGVARLDGTWPGRGADGARFADADHAYSEHLDVFGKGSLFQLLSRARTPQGEERLAAWLGAPADRAEVLARQAAVQELAPGVDLREDVALLGDDAATAAALAGLPVWGTAPPELPTGGTRLLHHLLPVPAVVALVLSIATPLPFWPVVALWVLAAIVARVATPAVVRVTEAVDGAARDLQLLSGMLERLERESFTAPRLRDLHDRIVVDGDPASHRIRVLERRVGAHDLTRNQFFVPVALFLFWPLQTAHFLESWRRANGTLLAGWVDALAEIEALLSLAGHAHENPDDVFPVVTEGDGPALAAVALGHPLLTRDRVVRNDVTIDAERRVHVVSGSNMSGKSTLLRTVGTNVALALAGGPVRAESMELTLLALGASIQVHDSLLDGESRFYAEVTRVGQVLGLAKSSGIPVLFLLDELFHGTNSADRRTGAAAVVRTLVERGAAGFVTTHDLAIAGLAEDIAQGVVNVHFEDRYEDGRMTFDYRMRPGVVTRSNALALMRAVGIDV